MTLNEAKVKVERSSGFEALTYLCRENTFWPSIF